MSNALLHVAAAVVQRPDGQVLLAQRPVGRAYAGYWEFPGGKIEPGETPREALDRELAEELGLAVRRAAPWIVQQYRYPHAHVRLHFFRVFEWGGDPIGRDGQAFAWQTPGRFDVVPMLPANTFVLRALLLPPVYGISLADELGESAFLARANEALAGGLALVELREKGWPVARQHALATALVALAQARGAKVMFNGDVELARAWGCAGVHLTSDKLGAATRRPDGMLCAASCHTRADIDHAGRLGLDFAVLGPVLPTPSHPGAATLGWEGFAAIAAEPPLPIYALGGLDHRALPIAIAHGAHGIALRRAAWPATSDARPALAR